MTFYQFLILQVEWALVLQSLIQLLDKKSKRFWIGRDVKHCRRVMFWLKSMANPSEACPIVKSYKYSKNVPGVLKQIFQSKEDCYHLVQVMPLQKKLVKRIQVKIIDILYTFQGLLRRQQKVNSRKAIQDPDCSSLNPDFCFARKHQQLNCIQRKKGNKCRIDQKLLLSIWALGRKHQLRCNSRYVNLKRNIILTS